MLDNWENGNGDSPLPAEQMSFLAATPQARATYQQHFTKELLDPAKAELRKKAKERLDKALDELLRLPEENVGHKLAAIFKYSAVGYSVLWDETATPMSVTVIGAKGQNRFLWLDPRYDTFFAPAALTGPEVQGAGGAVVLAHELGHLLLGIPDPDVVTFVENPVRTAIPNGPAPRTTYTFRGPPGTVEVPTERQLRKALVPGSQKTSRWELYQSRLNDLWNLRNQPAKPFNMENATSGDFLIKQGETERVVRLHFMGVYEPGNPFVDPSKQDVSGYKFIMREIDADFNLGDPKEYDLSQFIAADQRLELERWARFAQKQIDLWEDVKSVRDKRKAADDKVWTTVRPQP